MNFPFFFELHKKEKKPKCYNIIHDETQKEHAISVIKQNIYKNCINFKKKNIEEKTALKIVTKLFKGINYP